MSSQTSGTAAVGALSPKPVLFIHGSADEVLPDRCLRDSHARTCEPKELVLYPGCRHGLDQCRDSLDRDLTCWLGQVLGLAVASRGQEQARASVVEMEACPAGGTAHDPAA